MVRRVVDVHLVGTMYPVLLQSIEPATLSCYRLGCRRFYEWFRFTAQPSLPSSAAVLRFPSVSGLDRTLADYFQWCVAHRRPLGDVRNAFWGIAKFNPELDRSLPRSYKVMRAFERIRPSRSYTPLTKNLATLLAVHLAFHGHPRHAVCLLLAFDCYLRISEVTRLSRKRVFFGGAVAQLALWNTKTGKRRLQHVQVREPAVFRLLRAVDDATPPGQPYFPGGAVVFRRLLAGALRAVGVQGAGVRLSPHSLRHGGATHDWIAGDPFERIVERGRWRSSRSAKRYLQEARALILSLQLFPLQDSSGARLRASFEAAIWQCLAASQRSRK